MPEDNISSLQGFSYDEFSDRVKLLLDMSQEDYNLLMEKKEYMITIMSNYLHPKLLKKKL